MLSYNVIKKLLFLMRKAWFWCAASHMFLNSKPKRGTLIYVHKDLQANEVKTLNDTDCNESVRCTLKLSSGAKLLLGCIYRSPNSDDENNAKLNELVCKADLFPAKYKCIVGDFNFPSINWSLGDCKDPKSRAFINTILNCFLTQNVSNPTRHRDGQQSNLLDLIIHK